MSSLPYQTNPMQRASLSYTPNNTLYNNFDSRVRVSNVMPPGAMSQSHTNGATMKTNEERLAEENLALRKKFMDINAENFNLKSSIKKLESEGQVMVDAKVLELQSELKFKAEDVKKIRKELQATKQKLCSVQKALDCKISPDNSVGMATTQEQVMSHFDRNLLDNSSNRKSSVMKTKDNTSVHNERDPHVSSDHTNRSSVRNKRSREGYPSSYFIDVVRMINELYGHCHSVLNYRNHKFSENAKANRFNVAVQLLSERFSHFVSMTNFKMDNVMILASDIFYYTFIITSQLLEFLRKMRLDGDESKLKDKESANIPDNEIPFGIALASSFHLLSKLLEIFGLQILKPYYIEDHDMDELLEKKESSRWRYQPPSSHKSDSKAAVPSDMQSLKIPSGFFPMCDNSTMSTRAIHLLFKNDFRAIIEVIKMIFLDSMNMPYSILSAVIDFTMDIYEAWLSNQVDSKEISTNSSSDLMIYLKDLLVCTDQSPCPALIQALMHSSISRSKYVILLRLANSILSDSIICDEVVSSLSMSKNSCKHFHILLSKVSFNSHRIRGDVTSGKNSIDQYQLETCHFFIKLTSIKQGYQSIFGSSIASTSVTFTGADISVMEEFSVKNNLSRSIELFQELCHILTIYLRKTFEDITISKSREFLSMTELIFTQDICKLLLQMGSYHTPDERRLLFGDLRDILQIQTLLASRLKDIHFKEVYQLLLKLQQILPQ